MVGTTLRGCPSFQAAIQCQGRPSRAVRTEIIIKILHFLASEEKESRPEYWTFQ